VTLRPLIVNAGPEVMVKKVESACLKVLTDGKIPVVLGGEHSISSGAVAAVSKHYGEISVLQFDAHSDLRESYNGSRFSHACAMARSREHADSVQVGIRSMGEEEAGLVKRLRAEKKLFFASDILSRDCTGEIIDGLKGRVYVTFDVDAFDPSVMPSTGTPEPGGLGWYDCLRILRKLAQNREVVGFDVMELCPNKVNRSPDFMAAKLAYKMIGYVVCRSKQNVFI
jgi:agmatinase